MLKDHYENILAQLQSDVETLAKQHPELAVNLQRQNTDPDAARLLEGVALLAARQRLQMENDREEQSQGWLQAIAPDVLKPLPAMAIANIAAPTEEMFVPMGSALTSQLDTQVIHWRSAVPVQLLPVEVVSVDQDSTSVGFTLQTTGEWTWSESAIALQWIAPVDKGQTFLHELLNACHRVTITASGKTQSISKDTIELKNGVADGSWMRQCRDRFDQPMLPQWLRESLLQPQRTLAIEVNAPKQIPVSLASGEQFQISFELDGPVSQSVSAEYFTTTALPLINLKLSSLLPFTRREGKTLYELSMMSPSESTEQIVSIIDVEESTENGLFTYAPLHATPSIEKEHGVFQTIEQDVKPFYQMRLNRAGDDVGLVKAQAWIHQGDDVQDCVSGQEVMGDIGGGVLIETPTRWQPSLKTQAAQWQVWQTQQQANQSLSVENLKDQLQLMCPSPEQSYEQHRVVTRWRDSLLNIEITDAPITRGTSLILGQHVQLTLSFVSLPKQDAWWLSTLIWQWLRSRLPINSVMAFSIVNEKGEQVLYWPHASGTRAVV